MDSLSNSNGGDVNTSSSKSTMFEHKTKHLMKEKIIGHRSAWNLVISGHNIRLKISIMENFTLKAMSGRSRYNTTKNDWDTIFLMDTFSYQCQAIIYFKWCSKKIYIGGL